MEGSAPLGGKEGLLDTGGKWDSLLHESTHGDHGDPPWQARQGRSASSESSSGQIDIYVPVLLLLGRVTATSPLSKSTFSGFSAVC